MRVPRLVLSIAFALSATVVLHAQIGSYATYGTGCPGTGVGPVFCHGANRGGGQLSMLPQNGYSFAIPFRTTRTGAILGFDLYASSQTTTPITISTFLYAAAPNGAPTGAPLRTGAMTFTGQAGFAATRFKPLPVLANGSYLIAFRTAVGAWFPILRLGTGSSHYYQAPKSTIWKGPFANTAWAWRVVCAGSSPNASPALDHTGWPTIGRFMLIDLLHAKPHTAAYLILGSSERRWGQTPLPFSLGALGAPNCSLLTDPMMLLPAVAPTNAAGTTSFLMRIPNSQSLAGVKFYNQWLVVDPKANALGLAFSNGGVAQIR